MPQTFTQLHFHIVFSTKRRTPTITMELRERLYDYLGGIVRSLSGTSLGIGGADDHVHLFVSIPQTLSVADFVRTVKTNSSAWIHKTWPQVEFVWQTGYAAFTVSHSAISTVQTYIADQERHHRKRTFQDELRLLLTKHGLEPDERYMWE